eukprot:Partr_v1_DN24781_c0_g1_i4_m37141 putative UBX domain protein
MYFAEAAPESSSTSAASRPISDLSALKGSEKPPARQSFFTGGAQSGMMVEDPNKPDDSREMVEQILKKATEAGQRMHAEGADVHSKKPAKFSGSGYKLGSDEVPSEVVGSPASSSSASPTRQAGGEIVTRNMTFWRDGFSIEDGPLFRYDDPANKKILEAIHGGSAPLSLFGLKPGEQADVKVSHKLEEDYVKPKAVLKPFAGSGNRLGSVVPGQFPSSSTTPTAAAQTSAPVSAPKVNVDESKPVTSIQVRLADGTRMVCRFNLAHTVGDLRQVIAAARPSPGRAFTLQTQFPSKILDDDKTTLEQAGLKNAAILQKF